MSGSKKYKMFFKKKIDVDYVAMVEKFTLFEKKLKELREDLEKVEIKALESQKIYRRKLKNFVEGEEKTEDLNKSVFLGPNGTPL